MDGDIGLKVSSSLTSVRIPALESIKMHFGRMDDPLSDEAAAAILPLLFATHALYADPDSRTAALEAIEAVAKSSTQNMEAVVDFLQSAATPQKVLATTDYLTLLAWTNRLCVVCGRQGHTEALGKLARTQAKLLLLCTNGHSNHRTQHKNRVFKAVISSTKAAVASTVTACDSWQLVAQTYVDACSETSALPAESLALAGIVAEAAQALLPVVPAFSEFLATNSATIVAAYTSALLAKIPPSATATQMFGAFVTHYVDGATLLKTIAPAMEKAVLRLSENAFTVFLPQFFAAVAPQTDLSSTFSETKLLGSIVGGLKSAKDPVRAGAVTTIEHCLGHLKDTKAVATVLSEVSKVYKTVSSVENKATIMSIFESVPIGPASSEVANTVYSMIVRDQNEVSLSAGARVFLLHLMEASDATKEHKDLISKGLLEKKASLSKIWTVALCGSKKTSLWEEIMAGNREKLAAILEAAQNAPLPSATTGTLSAAYAIVAQREVLQLSPEAISACLTGSGDKPAILTDVRVLTKVPEDDKFLLSNALKAALDCFQYMPEPTKLQYAEAWTYLATSSTANDRLRILADLKELVTSELSAMIITNIYKAMQGDTACTVSRFAPVFSVLITGKDEEANLRNAAALLVAAHDDRIRIKGGWIGMCQRSGVDIGRLVEQNGPEMAETAVALSAERKVVFAALATLCFISPATMAPVASQTIETLFGQEIDYDDLLLRIWQGGADGPVVDVLDNKKAVDKNDRNYETDKWEAELRQELAKKGRAKKLTKEESSLVSAQMAKESAIRQEISDKFASVRAGIVLVEQLTAISVQGNDEAFVDTGSATWYPTAIRCLLWLLDSHTVREPSVYAEVGQHAVLAFLGLSRLVLARLGALRQFVGVAILRNRHLQLAENLNEEPLLALTGRILYRIKMLADQSPLDPLSLVYALPLLTETLQNGIAVARKNASKPVVTSEFVLEDPEEEHLLLAVEIVGSHAEAFEDPAIPRGQILAVLLQLLRLPARAKLAKETLMALAQHVSVSPQDSDLELLFSALLTTDLFARTAVLEALDLEFDLSGTPSRCEVWICAHLSDEQSAELAATVWNDSLFAVDAGTPEKLLAFFGQHDSELRLATATAWARAVQQLGLVSSALGLVFAEYHDKKNPPPPALDRFGLAIKSASDTRDRWEQRLTVALAILGAAGQISDDTDVERVFRFLVDERALGDSEPLVQQELQEAGVALVRCRGAACVEKLVPIFEGCLAAKDEGTKVQDRVKQSAIILYGAVARHLAPDDPRLVSIVERLLATLDTPSEDVQHAVAECIAPLVPAFAARLPEYFAALFTKLFEDARLPRRHGAAYGIAGLVKGCGIRALSEHQVMRQLEDAADDKKNPNKREGVSFAFECFSLALGKFFEPYVFEALPLLLRSLGDPSPEVRDAANLAARQIMKNTTSFGVKKMIPVVVSNLDDLAWRTKKGSVELLGAMAYLDPTQLSASLATIVPEIVGVLNDTHKEVRKAAENALKRFGEVIRNPEIQAVVPDLVRAIGDPTAHTDAALDRLLATQFVHYIDGPSLALIIHVVHRGMRSRLAATKKKACQIVGNMAILVDARDLRPYLPQLVAELEVAMVDPVPATRLTAARALGSLVEKLGEHHFPQLIPELMATLNDPSRAGDRLGSAQALAEVVCGLGIARLDELLPEILAGAQSPRSHVRAGFMPLLLFLPVCFGTQFAPYLARIIPPILAGLADPDEDIRDTALRAGRLIVKNYAKKAVDLLLPELEAGLQDENYRIRLSLLELTGDLLFQVTGISGKNELVDDLSEFSGEVRNSLIAVLGAERRSRVLALLFVCRSDASGTVRNAAADIWKALVANTPRTVKEILPTLTDVIVRNLAARDSFVRDSAAQTLGDVARRVGANALAQLLPTLELLLAAPEAAADPATRQGICIAVAELIHSLSHDAVAAHHAQFVQVVKTCLVDADAPVRAAAAQAFEALQNQLGKAVIGDVLPDLLLQLDSPDLAENALWALQDIMAAQADVVFPILLPKLLKAPVDTKALASLAAVAGTAVHQWLPSILNTVVAEEKATYALDDAPPASAESPLSHILLSVGDDGARLLVSHVLALAKHQDPATRATIYAHLEPFFQKTTLDYSAHTPELVSQLILALGDSTPAVVRGASGAMQALVNLQAKEALARLVKPAKQALELASVRDTDLPGFCLPRGPGAVLPIFLHGLMYGSADQKAAAAAGLADVISTTPAAVLRLFATAVTGPLIRVVGEKASPDTKAAILEALTLLLAKIPQFLRPFVPQLQRTFVRALADKDQNLRGQAVTALGALIGFQPRVDSLVAELVSGARSADDSGVRAAMLKALLAAVTKAGSSMNEASRTSVMGLVEDEMQGADARAVVPYARLVGALARIMSGDEAASVLRTKIVENPGVDHKFAILALNSFLRYAPHHLFGAVLPLVVDFVVACSNSGSAYISDNATVAIGKFLVVNHATKLPFSDDCGAPLVLSPELVAVFVNQLAILATCPPSNSPDTRRLALVVFRTVCRFQYASTVQPHLDTIVPAVFVCVRDPIIPIKLAAEKAFLAVLDLVEDEKMETFSAWFADKPYPAANGTTVQPRSISDYTKRVGSRLASVERERIAAGGDDETVFSDRIEDESEVWAVGGVEMS